MVVTELAIVGSGPAGLSAAIEAARHDAKVVVIDENKKPGGQLFKQIHKFFGSEEHHAGKRGIDIGYRLLQHCEQLGVEVLLDSVVLGVFPDESNGNKVLGLRKANDTLEKILAKKVILAAGAQENSLAFPGWTLPGVLGAGAAQSLANLHRVLPGKRILMVGSGNVGLIVSYQLAQAGADVVALIDALPEISGWNVHAAKISRMGIPIYTSHTIKEVCGSNKVESAVIGRVGHGFKISPGIEITFSVDTVCLAVGLSPMTELCQAAGCKFVYIPEMGGHIPLHNERMETTVGGIYVAGDMCGIEEASTALEEGKIAGIAAAESLGYLPKGTAEQQINDKHKSLEILRGGELGAGRRSAKEEIIRRWYNFDMPPMAGIDAAKQQKELPGFPTLEEIKGRKKIACIDCVEKIPCNPCEVVCPSGAITVGDDISSLPALNADSCTGCGMCIPACPGLAIFVVEYSYSDTDASVSMPYEFLPLPGVGDEVVALDRKGHEVATAKVIEVRTARNFDRTAVVTFTVEKDKCMEARNIKLIHGTGAEKEPGIPDYKSRK